MTSKMAYLLITYHLQIITFNVIFNILQMINYRIYVLLEQCFILLTLQNSNNLEKNASQPAKISSYTIPYHLQVHIYQERHMEETNKTYIEYK